MSRRLRQRRWTWRVAVFALTALTLGVGFCLFDGLPGATHHHAMTQDLSQDLCCGLLVSSLAVTLLALGAMNSVLVESPPAVYVTSLRGIDPPPKLLSLS
jgi:hypothetical protein